MPSLNNPTRLSDLIPDYSHGINRVWGTSYVATKDVFVHAYDRCAGQEVQMVIDGVVLNLFCEESGQGSRGGGSLFIKKGSTWRVQGGSGRNRQLIEFPLQGAI